MNIHLHFKKLCLHYPGSTLSTKRLKSVNNVLLPVCKMPSFDNRNAKRGRLMMLLLFHDVNIGFPLVLIVLAAFYKHSVTKASVPISSPSSTSFDSSDAPIFFINIYIDEKFS